MDRLIDEFDKSFREQDDPEAIQRQRDVEILSSIPGVGRIVLATLLAEASDVLLLRDYNALRALCGAASRSESPAAAGHPPLGSNSDPA